MEKNLLQLIGLNNAEKNLNELIKIGTLMMKNAAIGREPAFANDASFLTIDSPALKKEVHILVLDIGGSHTKVGLANCQTDNTQNWQMIFDHDNNLFNKPVEGQLPFEYFCKGVAEEVKRSAAEKKITIDTIDGVGVIWSNAMENFRLDGEVKGVSGNVSGIAAKKSYRKGEFFIKDLYDGFNLGQAIIDNLELVGIHTKTFVIGNDTVFTLKATKGADAGMVASTGANATSVDDKGFIYNSELGGLCKIPDSMLSRGDQIFMKQSAHPVIMLEDMMAGRWLPQIFEGQVIALAEQGVKEISALAQEIKQESFFTGKDLTAIMHNHKNEHLHKLEEKNINPAPEIIVHLLNEFAKRAGIFAAAMAYFSVVTQLPNKKHLVISLDSSQANHLPGYLDAMKASLSKIVGKHNVELVLQKPEGEVSVPMRGVATAVSELL